LIQVKQIQARDCYPIRQQILWQHKKLEDCGIDIDEQEGAFHLGVFLKDELVCIGSFFKQKNTQFSEHNQYRLRAMATVPKAQKQGTAKALLDFAFERLKNQNHDILWCDARLIAFGFYEKMGFTKKGKMYEIPLIGPHYLMWKSINVRM
jgi:[ribosomal protein S5]-alanine N-acetyltransferase